MSLLDKVFGSGEDKTHRMDLKVTKDGYFKTVNQRTGKIYAMTGADLRQLEADGKVTIISVKEKVEVIFEWNKSTRPTFD